MDFIDKVKQFSKRVETIKNSIQTEEATKTSIIMPFFSMLEYDVFNPLEFTPEFVADVGIKKGEKVDYAIVIDNEPVILIEVKSINKNLERHDSQLFRYFGTTKAKFAILTNGIIYRFYTDIDEINKMDKEPFFEINILKIKDSEINELKKFIKSNFNLNNMLDNAYLLKYERKFKSIISEQIQEPSDEFIKLFLQLTYSGPKTQTVIEKFRPILKKSLNNYISELLNDRILSAIENNKPEDNTENNINENISTSGKITPSDDEMEAFFIVKTILKNSINLDDIYFKKTESYFAILYKNNVRKWICRFNIKDTQKTLMLPTKNKEINKYTLENINDIMDYKNLLIDIVKRYINIPNLMENKIQNEPYKVKLYPRPPRKKRILPNKHLRKD